MFELSGVNYEEVLEQGDSILVRVIASSSYRGFELPGLYCIYSIIPITRTPDNSNPRLEHSLTRTIFIGPLEVRVIGSILYNILNLSSV